MTNNPVLSISRLYFDYDNKESSQLIANLSCELATGEILAILGASGCGKSTLLNIIAGLLKATSGQVKFRIEQNLTKQIGYIFQQDALLPWRDVRSNLMLAHEILNISNNQISERRLTEYLQTFHLKEEILNYYPAQLSGGMRQRVSIIQALMFDPQLLLLDEPFSALDFYTKLRLENEFHGLIKHHQKAAILVTHDIDEAIALADRIVIMSNGTFSHEFAVNVGDLTKAPEDARGSVQFAQYYNAIWSKLKAVILN